MKKKLYINNEFFETEVNDGKNGIEVKINNITFAIKLSPKTHNGFRSVLINEESYEVYCEEKDESHYLLSIGHNSYTINFGREPGADSEEEISVIHAPMAGLIAKLKVKEKDTITKGDALLILEAMKMQNELKSPRDAVIKEILIKEGVEVVLQEKLIILE